LLSPDRLAKNRTGTGSFPAGTVNSMFYLSSYEFNIKFAVAKKKGFQMKHEYYKNFREAIPKGLWGGNAFYGFPKNKVNVKEIRDFMKSHYFENKVYITDNLIIFQNELSVSHQGNPAKSKKLFQKARGLSNVIVFALMSFRNYKVTKTAKNIIIKNNLNEDNFSNNNFISVHENKLSVETVISIHKISLELNNVEVPIDAMEKERDKEIEERILNLLK
jgi:hypothetical protein